MKMSDKMRVKALENMTSRDTHGSSCHGWFQCFVNRYYFHGRIKTTFYLADELGGHQVPSKIVDMVKQ